MNCVAPALTTDHKKILQTKFTLSQDDEIYEITRMLKINSNINEKIVMLLVLRKYKER
jgi:hypothetical protein